MNLTNAVLLVLQLITIIILINRRKERRSIMADLTVLTAQVKRNTDVTSSAVQLIQGIAAQLKVASGDQTAVDTLATQLQTSADSLAAAIVANTPAAPNQPTA